MPYQPIENYGLIGNMRTTALVGMNGSIDWLCFPHFDSPSVFAAILDDGKGGRFAIAPVPNHVKSKQYYWPDTNVIVTRFQYIDESTLFFHTGVLRQECQRYPQPFGRWYIPAWKSKRLMDEASKHTRNESHLALRHSPHCSNWYTKC